MKLTMCYTTNDFWGAKKDNTLWFRDGCNDDTPWGTAWRQVKGRHIVDMDCGFQGRLFYKAKVYAGIITKIDEDLPYGNGGWTNGAVWTKQIEVRGNSDGTAIYTLMNDYNVKVRYDGCDYGSYW